MAMFEEEGKLHSNHIKALIFQLMMMLYIYIYIILKTSQLMNKSERQRGRMTKRKLKLAGGDHRLAQVFIRPQVFSIHMKGLKIRAQ
jgi:hypothetical protein